MMERTADIYSVNKVLINARESLFLAVKHLAENGHRRIVMFNPETSTGVEKSRKDGFLVSAEMFGLQDQASFFATKWYTPEDGYAAVRNYLALNELPSAIIAADSLMVGILQYFYEHNIHVPDDVSLLGLDNTFSGLTSPRLTTVAFPEKQMCETAIELILNVSTDGKTMRTAREISLSPYLIERDSVRKL